MVEPPLFAPFRALGYVTDNVPFAVNRRGKETWATFSVGKSWQIYNCEKLTLVMAGPQFPNQITALACKGEHTYAAVGPVILACRRVHQLHIWHGHEGTIKQLLLFGDFLMSLGSDTTLRLWRLDHSSSSAEKVIRFESPFRPTCFCHPPTYINKVLLGSDDGTLQLWNVATAKRIFHFSGWGHAVTCLEPSPALDVIAVGLADGTVTLHNIRYDESVVSFQHAASASAGGNSQRRPDDASACTCIAFRTGAGPPLMATGGEAGAIAVWHLEERRLQTLIPAAHRAALSRLHFFPGEPVLMSAGHDNAVVHWIFDSDDGAARRLRFRAGHSGPVKRIAHYGPQGRVLLSASADRDLRAFSVVQDQQSRELSQVHIERRAKRLRADEQELKLPVAVAMSACYVRGRDWPNILTAHLGETTAYCWQLERYRRADNELQLPPKERLDGTRPADVTAVCVSQCGNFGFVGTAGGRLDRYNMQSGLHRGQYCHMDSNEHGGRKPAHEVPIIGVGSDACNQTVVSVDHDGVMLTWAFKGGRLRGRLELAGNASCMHFQSHAQLAAVAALDFQVRQFRGHTDRLTDVQISTDCKWVLSASMDGTVRVWDLPRAVCLQAMHMGAPVVSLSLAPDNELLATAHAGHRGIYLWSNQLLFGGAVGITPSSTPVAVRLPHVAAGHVPSVEGFGEGCDLALLAEADDNDGDALPYTSEDESEQTQVSALDAEAEQRGQEEPYSEVDSARAPLPLPGPMLTTSGDASGKWETLVHLDAIKARNRPVEPPKKPEVAPFFLPSALTLPSESHSALSTDLVIPAGDDVEHVPAARRQTQVRRVSDPRKQSQLELPLMQLLQEGYAAGHYESTTLWLRETSGIVVEREVHALLENGLNDQDDADGLAFLLEYISNMLETRQNFDLAQGLLALVLKIHGQVIIQVPRLVALARTIHGHLAQAWANLDDDMNAVQCMVAMFSEQQL